MHVVITEVFRGESPRSLVGDNERIVAEYRYATGGSASCGWAILPVKNDLVVQPDKEGGDFVGTSQIAFLRWGEIVGGFSECHAKGGVAE